MRQPIVVAGATGNLGSRIVKALVERGAPVRALVRASSDAARVSELRALGATIISVVDPSSVSEIAAACQGASCVVSALLGTRETMIDAQTVLLNGAVQAGVPRFIPSDYSIDFNKLERGENRNLDWHFEFQQRVNLAPIKATSVLNGAFTELLVGPAPFILWKWKRVLYWGSAEVPLEFTTMNDTAALTAEAALDDAAPRFLFVTGQRLSARELAAVVSEVTGESFKTLRAGGLGLLKVMITAMRALMPAPNAPFPPWQGMQYMHNMYSGRAVMERLDNQRYPALVWKPVRALLAESRAKKS